MHAPRAYWALYPASVPWPRCVPLVRGVQEFVGTQNVSSATSVHARACTGEAWQLTVRIQGSELKRGYLCGVMEALNVPSANSSVSRGTIDTSRWLEGRALYSSGYILGQYVPNMYPEAANLACRSVHMYCELLEPFDLRGCPFLVDCKTR